MSLTFIAGCTRACGFHQCGLIFMNEGRQWLPSCPNQCQESSIVETWVETGAWEVLLRWRSHRGTAACPAPDAMDSHAAPALWRWSGLRGPWKEKVTKKYITQSFLRTEGLKSVPSHPTDSFLPILVGIYFSFLILSMKLLLIQFWFLLLTVQWTHLGDKELIFSRIHKTF